MQFVRLESLSQLSTPKDWSDFEASLLTIGLFNSLQEDSPESTLADKDYIRLWRAVLDRALFDFLRGPLVDITGGYFRPRDPGESDAKWNARLAKLDKSKKAYRDVVHWLHERSDYDGLETFYDSVESDFTTVCEGARIDPSLVRTAFTKLKELKGKVVGVKK